MRKVIRDKVVKSSFETLDPETGEVQEGFVGLDEEGREMVDPRPLALPARAQRPMTMAEQVARVLRSQSHVKDGEYIEPFEEADDFEIPDDPADPGSVFEEEFDPTLGRSVTPQEVLLDEQGPRRFRQTAQQIVDEHKAGADSQVIDGKDTRSVQTGAEQSDAPLADKS